MMWLCCSYANNYVIVLQLCQQLCDLLQLCQQWYDCVATMPVVMWFVATMPAMVWLCCSYASSYVICCNYACNGVIVLQLCQQTQLPSLGACDAAPTGSDADPHGPALTSTQEWLSSCQRYASCKLTLHWISHYLRTSRMVDSALKIMCKNMK